MIDFLNAAQEDNNNSKRKNQVFLITGIREGINSNIKMRVCGTKKQNYT